MNGFRRKMKKQKKATKGVEFPLAPISKRRGRGRPRNCRYSEIWGRAVNYRGIFSGIWERLSGPLLAVQTKDEVIRVFQTHATPYVQEFVPRLAENILEVIREKKFPKRPRAQIKFLANSLAGLPSVEPRTSRDICAKRLAEQKAMSPHKILRKEFYVECSCGYRGAALNDACRKCGAQISFLPELLHGIRPF
jgi:hypothetical protein